MNKETHFILILLASAFIVSLFFLLINDLYKDRVYENCKDVNNKVCAYEECLDKGGITNKGYEDCLLDRGDHSLEYATCLQMNCIEGMIYRNLSSEEAMLCRDDCYEYWMEEAGKT